MSARRGFEVASLQSPQDAHLLGQRVERPSNRRAREVYAAFLGVDARELERAESGGVWRWFASDRTVRWAPREGAPWAMRKKARRDACESPRELWELLAARGIIPAGWIGSEDREFYDAPARGESAVSSECPVTLEAALKLASDVDGVVSAEHLMHEAAGLLAPWGTPRPAKLRWSAFPTHREWYQEGHAGVIPPFLADLVERTENGLARRRDFVSEFERGTEVPPRRTFVAQRLLELSLAWRQWCAEDRRVPETRADWPPTFDPNPRARERAWMRCPKPLVGKPFRELVDPTPPLLAIVALGYTPDMINSQTAMIGYRAR